MPTERPRNTPEHRPQRHFGSRAAEAIIKSAAFISYAQYYGIQEARRLMGERGNHVGLLEGAILAPQLAYPNSDGIFTYETTRSAEYRWYDPFREATFPRLRSMPYETDNGEGALWMYYPEELVDNDEDTPTPLWLLQPFSAEHLKTLDKCSIEEMIGREVVRATTMAEAYERVGMPDFAEELERRGLAGERVFQVTPKGNTLIDPREPSGSPKPKREERKITVTLPVRLAGP